MIKVTIISILSVILAMLLIAHLETENSTQTILVIPQETIVSTKAPGDTFSLEFYTIDYPYLEAAMIETVLLKSPEIQPFKLVDFKKEAISFALIDAKKIQLTLQVPHQLEGGYERYQNAPLILRLVDGTTMEIPIGPLSFVYEKSTTDHLTYRQIHNLPGRFAHGITAKGMIIELENLKEDAVLIESLDIFAATITVDHDHIVAYDHAIEGLLRADEIFNDEALMNQQLQLPIELKGHEKITLLMPFSYQDETMLLHRYPIHIQTSKGVLYIPTFPYINTTLYLEENLPLKQEGMIDDSH